MRNIPCCCYPQVSGPCVSTSVGGRALTPPSRLRLGRLLPHQLADGPQAPPGACVAVSSKPTFSWSVLTKPTSAVLATVSSGCPPLLGRSPTSYSPVRHSRPCLGHRPPQSLPSDLHALGTPLAFILSQDQTLRICPCATFQVAPSGCFGSILELFFSNLAQFLSLFNC